MEVIKKKSGSSLYREKLYVDGKEIKSPRFLRKTDAKTWKQNMLLERSKSGSNLIKFSQSSQISFKEFSENFLEFKVKEQMAFKTYEVYKSRIKVHMNPFFGGVALRKLNLLHLNQLIHRLKMTHHNATGINNIVRTFKRVISEAIHEGYLLQNPFTNIKKMKEDLKSNVFLTNEEIKALLSVNRDHFLYPLIVVALNTGMRRGELAGLCWDKVDFENQFIEVARTRDRNGLKDTTKTGERRYIPMNDVVFGILSKLNKDKLNKFVFIIGNGQAIDTHHLYRLFQAMLKKAGITRKFCFHDLRHTFASHFMMNGGNLYDLQKILGHRKSDMTNRYAHLSKNHLKKSISSISFI